MATKLTASNLTVTISESVSIAGKDQGGSISQTITGITSVFKRIIPVPQDEVILYDTHDTSVAGSTFDVDNVKYVRITNYDSANDVDIIVDSSATDEYCHTLKSGESMVLWNHKNMCFASDTALTVVDPVQGTANMTVADGDAANGMTEGQYLQLINRDGITKNFVISDTNAGGAATGTVLTSATDIGSNTFGTLTSAVTEGVAVGFNKSSATQNAMLVQLKAAIEHANGMNGRITCGTVPVEANGNQILALTQGLYGLAGNTVTTTDIANLTAADFTTGVDGGVASKLDIRTITAIAHTDTVDVEVFVASS